MPKVNKSKNKKEKKHEHLAADHTLDDEIFKLNPNCKYILSIDESGRGNWAGDVMATAYLHSRSTKYFKGIGDSKKLKRPKIASLFNQIKAECESYHDRGHDDPITMFATVSKSSKVIDKINILQATFKCMKEATEDVIQRLKSRLKKTKEVKLTDDMIIILIDGKLIPYDENKDRYDIFEKYETRAIIKGDQKSYTIAAASILTKHQQVKEMQDVYHPMYPEYGFDTNSGYRSKKHIDAIWKYGVLPIHRLSFNCKELGGTLGRLQILQAILQNRNNKNIKNIIQIINNYLPDKK